MLKFAVIGCGNLAQRSSIPALLKSGVSSISVCVDINPEREKDIKEKFHLPFEISFDIALQKYSFDVVYISTPNSVHKDYVKKAAINNKHILCEKSLSSSLEDIFEMVQICKENNIALFEGFMYQFHTQHKWISNYIDSGKIGIPFHFQAWFGFPPLNKDDFRYSKVLGGGAVLDAGAYTIHSARHFFNQEPISIYSILEKEDSVIETRGTVMLGFSEGKTAHLVFGFNNCYQNTYTIWGTNGVIRLNRAFSIPEDFCSTIIIEKQGFKKTIKMKACNHFVEELKYFCSNLNNTEIKKNWYAEALSQGKVLNEIKKKIN